MNVKLKVGDKAPDFLFETPWEGEKRFYEAVGGNPAVLVFLRYLGCPICQIDMANLKREIDLIEQKKAVLFVFIQSSPETVASATKQEDWPFTIICDPKGDLFKLYHVEPGSILRYMHPAGLIMAIKATFQGYKHGKFEGKETQLPAVFIVAPDKTIKFTHYGEHLSDVPSTATMAANI